MAISCSTSWRTPSLASDNDDDDDADTDDGVFAEDKSRAAAASSALSSSDDNDPRRFDATSAATCGMDRGCVTAKRSDSARASIFCIINAAREKPTGKGWHL